MHELANYQDRIFVITGMCRDLFCTPSNQMIFFDRLLHIYLKENLEYESVVFLDSRGIYYYDVESKNILKSIDDIKKTNAHSKLKRYKNLVIKKDDIKIDFNHSEYLASMKINTKDQKGLFAYIAKVFDDFNIEVESAKLITSKGYDANLS